MALIVKRGRVFPGPSKEQVLATSPEIQVLQTVSNFAFEVTCFGLKPSTKHYFFDGNVNNNKTSMCEPIGGVKGDPLITNASGELSFKYYFTGDMVISGSSTVIPASGNTANATITQSVVSEGSRTFIITSSETPSENYAATESSYAQYAITISAGTGDITDKVTPVTTPVYESGGGGMVGEQWLMDDAATTTRKVF